MAPKSTRTQTRWNVHRIRAEREAMGIPSPPHPLYSTWQTMRSRCNRPTATQYENYGARGITVCDQWDADFAIFYLWAIDAGWERGLQLDRINNNGPYSPENCRWVTSRQNNNNRRNTPKYEYDGEMLSAREIYEAINPAVSFDAFRARLRLGWTVDESSAGYYRKSN